MLQSWVESLRFSTWVLPVGFLRLYVGYLYLTVAQDLWLMFQKQPGWLQVWIQHWGWDPFWVIPLSNLITHHVTMTIVVALHIGVAISYLLGYLVRPLSVLALLLSFFHSQSSQNQAFWSLLFVIHLFLFWIGAGRIMGFDYHFYKHYRGFWW